MKRLLIIFLIVVSNSSAQNKLDSTQIRLLNKTQIELNKAKLQIDSLNSAFLNLNSQFEYQIKLSERTLNSISNQISASSYNLTIFGILFTIGALVLGVYVTYIERKIVKLRENNESLLKQTQLVKNEVVSINEKIQNDIYGLFLKIKREETVYMLKRLEKIPWDITNLSNELLSRELLNEDFIILKKAYLKLENNSEYTDPYLLLFFQHFLDLSLKDEYISNKLKGFFSYAIDCAFENDIIKSTEDFMKAIVDLGYQNKTNEINEFIKALSQSEHNYLEEIYHIIIRSLVNKDDQFNFFNIINDNKESRISKSEYGKHLLKIYGNTKLSESENLVKEKTEQIITQLNQEEIERKAKIEEKKKPKKRDHGKG